MLKKRKFKSIFFRRSQEEMQNVYSRGNGSDFRKPEQALTTGESSLRLCPIAGDKSNEYIQEAQRWLPNISKYFFTLWEVSLKMRKDSWHQIQVIHRSIWYVILTNTKRQSQLCSQD